MKRTVCCVIFLMLCVCLLTSCNPENKCEHEYGEWKVLRWPSCSEVGISERVRECGHKETKDIAILNHRYENGICINCKTELDKSTLAPGAYDEDFNLIADWDRLVKGYGMQIEENYMFVHGENELFAENDHRPEKIFYSDPDLARTQILVVPEGVERIGKYALYDSRRLTEVILPKSLKRIDSRAFYNCTSLTTINLENVQSIGEYAFGCCSKLEQINLTESLTTLEAGAFGGCGSLMSATLPDSLSEIGAGVFSNCEGLYRVHLPLSLTEIPDDCFKGCKKLFDVNLHEGLVSIGKSAFKDCDQLKKATMPSTMRIIGAEAYYSSGITEIYLNDGLTHLGARALSSCNALKEIIIPDSVTELGVGTFYYSSFIERIVIGSGVTNIPKSFAGSCWALCDIQIGENVAVIEDGAFEYCWMLRSITIPENITYIGDDAFVGCNRLVEIINLSDIDLCPSGSHPSKIDKYAMSVHTGESKIFREGDFLCYNLDGVLYLLDYVGNMENPTLPETIGGKEYIVWEMPID